MKPVRWLPHALQNIVDREVDRRAAEQAVMAPEFTVPSGAGRNVCMRKYYDTVLGQEMLVRAVVEETDTEIVVVTVYKTSQIFKYLKGVKP